MKVVKYPSSLTSEDILDITLMIEARELQKFAINYRANIEDEWYEVYRVDNYHGFLHEQRFWSSSRPILIKDKEGWTLQMVFEYYIDEVTDNFERYRLYFEEALNENRIKRKDKNEKKNSKRRTEKKGGVN